jgi:transposase InsO family protein
MVIISSIYNINCQCTIFTQFSKQPGEPLLEAPVYRLLKAHDLIASPAFIVIKAADAFKDKTTAPNQLWQTDFTYLKVIGWGWFYLSTVLDDFSRYIVAWKLCTTMTAEGVTATLELALQASGLDQANLADRPRLLSDNGSSYVAGDLAKWLAARNIKHLRGAPYHPMTQGKIERWHHIRRSRTASCWKTTSCPAISKPRSRPSSPTTTTAATTRASTISPGRRLLRTRPNHPGRTTKDQTANHGQSPAASTASRLTSPDR